MKATLEFNLPKEANEFKLASRGPDYWKALWELEQEFRRLTKYGLGPDTTIKTPEDMLEYLSKVFYDLTEDCLLEDIE